MRADYNIRMSSKLGEGPWLREDSRARDVRRLVEDLL